MQRAMLRRTFWFHFLLMSAAALASGLRDAAAAFYVGPSYLAPWDPSIGAARNNFLGDQYAGAAKPQWLVQQGQAEARAHEDFTSWCRSTRDHLAARVAAQRERLDEAEVSLVAFNAAAGKLRGAQQGFNPELIEDESRVWRFSQVKAVVTSDLRTTEALVAGIDKAASWEQAVFDKHQAARQLLGGEGDGREGQAGTSPAAADELHSLLRGPVPQSAPTPRGPYPDLAPGAGGGTPAAVAPPPPAAWPTLGSEGASSAGSAAQPADGVSEAFADLWGLVQGPQAVGPPPAAAPTAVAEQPIGVAPAGPSAAAAARWLTAGAAAPAQAQSGEFALEKAMDSAFAQVSTGAAAGSSLVQVSTGSSAGSSLVQEASETGAALAPLPRDAATAIGQPREADAVLRSLLGEAPKSAGQVSGADATLGSFLDEVPRSVVQASGADAALGRFFQESKSGSRAPDGDTTLGSFLGEAPAAISQRVDADAVLGSFLGDMPPRQPGNAASPITALLSGTGAADGLRSEMVLPPMMMQLGAHAGANDSRFGLDGVADSRPQRASQLLIFRLGSEGSPGELAQRIAHATAAEGGTALRALLTRLQQDRAQQQDCGDGQGRAAETKAFFESSGLLLAAEQKTISALGQELRSMEAATADLRARFASILESTLAGAYLAAGEGMASSAATAESGVFFELQSAFRSDAETARTMGRAVAGQGTGGFYDEARRALQAAQATKHGQQEKVAAAMTMLASQAGQEDAAEAAARCAKAARTAELIEAVNEALAVLLAPAPGGAAPESAASPAFPA